MDDCLKCHSLMGVKLLIFFILSSFSQLKMTSINNLSKQGAGNVVGVGDIPIGAPLIQRPSIVNFGF